ncbi:MAG: hypothetical protein M3490_00735 [Chloroflexota bacterium]|nr:hypothetical protein [Chloroflexota bacterium]
MPDALLVVDVQHGFINPFTKHVPDRISRLIERERHKTVLFTRFVNIEGSPFRRMLDWDACAEPSVRKSFLHWRASPPRTKFTPSQVTPVCLTA